MGQLERKSFDRPDEVREFRGKGHAEIIQVGGRAVVRSTYEPGWKWTENVKPIVGTDSCDVEHFAYLLSGRLRVTMDSGESEEAGPGDLVAIAPGHQGEVVGDEPCVWLDFGDVEGYAKG